MKIQLLGNCTVILTTREGKIIFDPYFSQKGNLVFKRGKQVSEEYKSIEELDGILLSHDHFDHMDRKFLNRFKDKGILYAPKLSIKTLVFNKKSVSIGDRFTIKDMKITVVQAKHVCPAVGYIIEAEGKTIYFAGDTYYRTFMKNIANNFNVDVAILPITNYFPPMTMGKNDVEEVLDLFKPQYFIPMHKDLVKRTNTKNSTTSKEELIQEINKVNTDVSLIYLENGEFFEI